MLFCEINIRLTTEVITELRKQLLEKLSDQDQSELGRIAVYNPSNGDYWWIRHYAVRKITNQVVLASVAMNDCSEPVRCTAVNKCDDEAVLGKIAVEDVNDDVRRAASERLGILSRARLGKRFAVPLE